MQTATLASDLYFMTMIDDYNKYSTVHLLKNKWEAASKIREFVESAETKFQKTPKKIRSDRSGEYTRSELKNFLMSKGIQSELTCPHAPEQNGCAERKNRYLTEMTRSTLIYAELPNKYSGEALMTANHLQNMLPVYSLLTFLLSELAGALNALQNYRRSHWVTAILSKQ